MADNDQVSPSDSPTFDPLYKARLILKIAEKFNNYIVTGDLDPFLPWVFVIQDFFVALTQLQNVKAKGNRISGTFRAPYAIPEEKHLPASFLSSSCITGLAFREFDSLCPFLLKAPAGKTDSEPDG